MAAAISMWLRRGATAVAASRVGIGFVALGAPLAVSRSWVGRSGDGPPGVVLGRALGSRDLALGLGALIALRRQEKVGQTSVWSAAAEPAPAPTAAVVDPAEPVPAATAPAATASAALSGAAAWVGLAALADGFDLWTTARSWDELPPVKRWLVALSSGGAAAVGAAATVSLLAGAVRRGVK